MTQGLESFAASITCVCRGDTGLRHFPAMDTASLCLVGAGVREDDLVHAGNGSVQSLPALPVLALLQAPTQGLPEEPAAIHSLLVDALRRHAARPDVLALALEVLPADASVERRFLAQALAHVVRPTTTRDGRKADAASPGRRPVLELHAGSDDPHAVLDRCFEVFAAWRAQREGSFETRPAQSEMAHAVLETLLHRETLLVEAGAGTGKSLAYALPALLVSLWRGGRVVLSTQTRPLQEQLVRRELPALWECFGLAHWPRADGRTGLRFAKLLGRSNYVCLSALRRWVRWLQEQGGSVEAGRLVLALLRHPDGCLDDLAHWADAAVRDALRSRRETCTGRACRGEPPCPVYVARESARQADVLVVNHALLCADGRLDGTLLGECEGLVVDEAHDLEEVATEALAHRFGPGQAEALLRAVGRLESEVHGVSLALEAQPWRPALQGLADAARRFGHETQGFLADLDAALPVEPRDPPQQRYRDADEVFGRVRSRMDGVQRALEQFQEESNAFLEVCETVPLDVVSAGVFELAEVVRTLVEEARAAFTALQRTDDDGWVTFLDFSTPDAALRQIVAAPVDVGPALQELLARPQRGVVYTSATLDVEGEPGYVRRRLGVHSAVPSLSLPSPFDFETQCTVVCTPGLGDYRDAGFVEAMADVVTALHQRTGRRMLVLLTSHRMLRALYDALRARLGPAAPLRAQGISGSRSAIAAHHAVSSRGILLGTSSFWTGIDFPGEAVEIVVLAKLPFEPPDAPLVEGRCERFRAAGDDPFESYVLPEALLRFRQGVGRLIRSSQDRGAVVLLDRRLETHPYGARFLASLPRGALHFDVPMELVEHVRRWFDGSRSPSP